MPTTWRMRTIPLTAPAVASACHSLLCCLQQTLHPRAKACSACQPSDIPSVALSCTSPCAVAWSYFYIHVRSAAAALAAPLRLPPRSQYLKLDLQTQVLGLLAKKVENGVTEWKVRWEGYA